MIILENCVFKSLLMIVDEMGLRLKALTTKCDNASLILRTHKVEGYNILLDAVLKPLHEWHSTYLHSHTKEIRNKQINHCNKKF